MTMTRYRVEVESSLVAWCLIFSGCQPEIEFICNVPFFWPPSKDFASVYVPIVSAKSFHIFLV